MAQIRHAETTPPNAMLKSRVLLGKLWKLRMLYLFILPAVVFTLVFNYRPIYGIIMAFQDYDIIKGLGGSPFIGLENFENFLSSPTFTGR